MILPGAITSALILALLGFLIFGRSHGPRRSWLLWLMACAGIAGGLVLSIVTSPKLQDYLVKKQWPETKAVILSSKVLGVRAFHPEIIYEYSVGGRSYRDTTDMGVPGFGTKANRLNVAETTILRYSAGDTLIVIYDADDPGISDVRSSPRFSVFIGWISGIGLLAAGSLILLRLFFAHRAG